MQILNSAGGKPEDHAFDGDAVYRRGISLASMLVQTFISYVPVMRMFVDCEVLITEGSEGERDRLTHSLSHSMTYSSQVLELKQQLSHAHAQCEERDSQLLECRTQAADKEANARAHANMMEKRHVVTT